MYDNAPIADVLCRISVDMRFRHLRPYSPYNPNAIPNLISKDVFDPIREYINERIISFCRMNLVFRRYNGSQ